VPLNVRIGLAYDAARPSPRAEFSQRWEVRSAEESMAEAEPDYLELFADWLGSLGTDAVTIAALVPETALPEGSRRALVGALNYLFKSLDLIPDGIDDIGYLDDAFVLRVSAELALQEDTSALTSKQASALHRLADETDAVRVFLGKDWTRLLDYVKGLRKGSSRGRAVDNILRESDVQTAFLNDVHSFSQSYQVPRFAREEKTLVKLRAFFDAKLPK
jgi:uncharacterized membrane protein YkvA (DUF1232 family)